MEFILALLGFLKYATPLVVVLGLLWKTYKIGYDKGRDKAKYEIMAQVAKADKRLFKKLVALIDDPNSAFKLRSTDNDTR